MKTKNLWLVLCALFSLASCTKDNEEGASFAWMNNGKTLYYDFYTTTETITDFRQLDIWNGFYETAPGNTDSWAQLFYYVLPSVMKYNIGLKSA